MTRKESALNANIKSWSDPIAKKKSLKQGRERAYKENRQTIGASFKPETIKRIAEAKFIKANNLLAIHLIEKDIAPTSGIVIHISRRSHVEVFIILLKFNVNAIFFKKVLVKRIIILSEKPSEKQCGCHLVDQIP